MSLSELKKKGLVWEGNRQLVASPLELPCAKIHEFFFEVSLGKLWFSPLRVVSWFAEQKSKKDFYNIWIDAWPYAKLPENNLLLDCKSTQERFWCAQKALSSPSVAAVVCNAKNFSHLATRKLHLAARKQNTIAFLLRPPWEIQKQSAASTRWLVTPEGDTWKLELITTKQKWLVVEDENHNLNFSTIDHKRNHRRETAAA